MLCISNELAALNNSLSNVTGREVVFGGFLRPMSFVGLSLLQPRNISRSVRGVAPTVMDIQERYWDRAAHTEGDN